MGVSTYKVSVMTTATENPTIPHSMLYARDVVPYLSRFIESGGTIREAVDGREGPPIFGVMVTYNSKSVLLASGHMGVPIALMVPNNLDGASRMDLETGFRWEHKLS